MYVELNFIYFSWELLKRKRNGTGRRKNEDCLGQWDVKFDIGGQTTLFNIFLKLILNDPYCAKLMEQVGNFFEWTWGF